MRLFQYLVFFRYSLVSYIFVICVSFGFALEMFLGPGLGILVYDRLLASLDPYLLAKYLVFNLFLFGYSLVLSFIISYSETKASTQISNQIKLSLMKRLYKVQYKHFVENDSGFFMKRITEDSDMIAQALSKCIVVVWNIILIILICYFFYQLESFLFSIYIILLGLSVIWIVIWNFPAHHFNGKIGQGYTQLHSHISEIISGIKEIKFNTLNDHAVETVLNTTRSLKWNFLLNSTFGNMIWQLASFFPLTAYGLILSIGISKVEGGEMSVGLLLGVLAAVWSVFSPVSNILGSIHILQSGVTAASRVQTIVNAPLERSGTEEFKNIVRTIEIKNLSFSYPNGKKVLDSVNISFKKGQKIGIVGRSGAGKTTLIQLILGLLDGYEGEILLDGINISEYSIESVRRSIIYLSQDTYMFDESLRSNVDIHGECSDVKIIESINRAELKWFLCGLENGLDTPLGARGVGMSGGEKQRVALARCFTHDYPIILLDEVTSSLDSETESLVLKELETEIADKTGIIISHRLSAMVNTDKIFVLSEGSIVEEGTHSELIECDGTYADLFRMNT